MFSKWHKIDLHIHTDKSKETKNNDYKGDFDIDVLIDKLENNDIEMISFTDHNIINCSAYDEFKDKCNIKLLTGVELDVAISEDDLKKYVINLKDESGVKVDVKPFHILVIFNSEDYETLNELLDKMYEAISKHELDSKIDLNTEKKLRTTTFKYLIEYFREESFFIIAHGDKAKGIVPPHKKTDSIEEAQYNILMGEISALEMKSNMKMKHAIEAYNEGFSLLLKDEFRRDPAPYVVFSDNHNCANYETAELSTWLKGALDYETLRIGFSDPESRIHTDNKLPAHASFYIDELVFTQKNGHIDKLEFSPHLNVIIGGRSSGKSLLFNTLVNLNSSLSPEDKEVYEVSYKNLVDSEATFIKASIGKLENNVSIDAEVYCQEKIINLFKDHKELQNKLNDFFYEFSENEIESKENEIEELFKELKKTYRDYYSAQNRIDKGDRSSLIEESSQTSNKIFEINTKELEVDYDVTYHEQIAEELNDLADNLGQIKIIEFKGKDLFDKDEMEMLDNVEGLLKKKVELVEKSRLKTELHVGFFDRVKKLNEEYIRNELGQEMQKIESAKKTLEDDIDDYFNYFNAKLALRKACVGVENIDVEMPDKEYDTPKYIFVTKLNFKIDKEVIKKKLFVESILNYDIDKDLYSNMVNIADPKYTEIRIKQKTGLEGKSPDRLSSKIDDFVAKHKANKQHEIVEKGSSPISTASTSQGRRASIFVDVKLSSFAEKKADCVLMVDQIEDNIDNKFISESLVGSLRDLKKNMQIILVTHNPSIAVYGDAENVIISENNEGQISYIQGGLENESIRNEACQILDGGDIAFKNRMEKYNIEKLISEHTGEKE